MKKLFILYWFIIQICLLSGQEAKSYLNLIGGWNNGPCNAVCRAENILYIGNGCNLDIVDITEPTAPVFVSHFNCKFYIQFMQIDDNYLFVESNCELDVFDISNIQSPVLINGLDFQDIIDIEIKNDYLYLINAYQWLRIYNISDPFNITLINNIFIGEINYALYAEDNYLYFATAIGCLRIIDVSDPLNPDFLGVANFECYADDVAVSNQIACIANEECGLRIFDVSNPLNPVQLSCFQNIFGAEKVTIKDNLAFVVHGSSIKIIDINDPENPFTISSVYLDGSVNSILPIGNYLYLANSDGMNIVDIQNPASPVVLSFYNTPYYATDIELDDNIAYVAESLDGIYILDVTDPDNISVINQYKPEENVYNIACANQKIYISLDDWSEDDILEILDVSNPMQPVVIGSYDDVVYINDFTVSDTLTYMIGYEYEYFFRVLNTVDPSNITEIYSNTSFDDYLICLCVKGNYALVGKHYEGFSLFNISDPYNVLYLSEVEIADPDFYLNALNCNDNHVFLGHGYGLMIYNIEDPENPYLEGEYNSGTAVWSIEIMDDHLVCGTSDGIFLLDISDFSNPVFAEEMNFPYYVDRMCYTDSILYLTAGPAGIYLLNNDSTGGTTSIHAESNPTEGLPYYVTATGNTIIIRSQDMMQEVSLFSITGEKIAQVNQIESSTAEINVTGFTGGSYIIRIRFASGIVKAKKIIF